MKSSNKTKRCFAKNTFVNGAVEPVLLSPLVDELTGFGQVSALTMLQHLFSSNRVINKIDLEENAVKIMGPYNPAESLDRLVEQLGKGIEFNRAAGQKIFNAIMMSKVISVLAKTGIFNDNIREWRRKCDNLKTWAKYKLFFH